MWNHGKAFIEHIFKRRTHSLAIRAELEPKAEAYCDRSNIRMFEAGLSAQRHGDYEQSPRNLAEEESVRLSMIAKEQGLYIEKSEWNSWGDRKRLPSGESIILLDKEMAFVYKVRDPFAKAAIKNLRPEDIIYEHLVHNILFPSTKYELVGISDNNGEIRLILKQKYIPHSILPPSQKLIDDYLVNGLGLKKEGRYFYGNNYVAITDVSENGDNVLYSDGEFYFIDPIIRFKRPAKEILDYYYSIL